ncbi:hypothetical protein LDENG_00164990 [Lucifuga dentata]|nr:hypothetical protein LDENG_00164990 [Lucifuga dentata]
MALNLPSDCQSCIYLGQRISELERRISMLYQIQEAEKLSGTIVFSNGQAITSTTKEMDATVPYHPANSSLAAASALKDPWIQLGAKPKAPISSTPVQHLEPWITVGHHKRLICSSESSVLTNGPIWSSSPPIQTSVPPAIQLENQFSVLYDQEFPPLTTPCPPSSPASTSTAPVQSPELRNHPPPQADQSRAIQSPSTRPAVRLSQGATVPKRLTSLPLLITPTTLVVDSIIQNIRSANAITHCFPRATAADIVDQLSNLLDSVPSSVKKTVVHVGKNDTSR